MARPEPNSGRAYTSSLYDILIKLRPPGAGQQCPEASKEEAQGHYAPYTVNDAWIHQGGGTRLLYVLVPQIQDCRDSSRNDEFHDAEETMLALKSSFEAVYFVHSQTYFRAREPARGSFW